MIFCDFFDNLTESYRLLILTFEYASTAKWGPCHKACLIHLRIVYNAIEEVVSSFYRELHLVCNDLNRQIFLKSFQLRRLIIGYTYIQRFPCFYDLCQSLCSLLRIAKNVRTMDQKQIYMISSQTLQRSIHFSENVCFCRIIVNVTVSFLSRKDDTSLCYDFHFITKRRIFAKNLISKNFLTFSGSVNRCMVKCVNSKFHAAMYK